MKIYLIDAYNVIHAWKSCGLISASAADGLELLKQISSLADAIDGHITVVFDGHSAQAELLDARFRHITILYSSREATADSIIEKRVQEKKENESITVVTSDNMIKDLSYGSGAIVISPKRLWEMARESQKDLDRRIHPSPTDTHKKRPTLGDFFPPEKNT